MRLYVGNLPFKATEADLQDWFGQAGVAVDNITVVKDKFSGEPRGFGFVDISNTEHAELAIRVCNGKELLGRALVVNEARPMNPDSGRGRGSGGGRSERRPRY